MAESYKNLKTENMQKVLALATRIEDNPPPYEISNHSEGIVFAPIFNDKPTVFKLQKTTKILAIVQLILALILLIFGSTCTGITYAELYTGVCLEGSGIWVGILCLVTSAIGLSALRQPITYRCLLIAYFVLLIISIICCGIAIIFSGIWINRMSRIYNYYYSSYYTARAQTMLALTIITLLASIIHFILSIISSALICYNWNGCCNERPAQVHIIYHQNSANPVTLIPRSDGVI